MAKHSVTSLEPSTKLSKPAILKEMMKLLRKSSALQSEHLCDSERLAELARQYTC